MRDWLVFTFQNKQDAYDFALKALSMGVYVEAVNVVTDTHATVMVDRETTIRR